jgi:hypothetical protein
VHTCIFLLFMAIVLDTWSLVAFEKCVLKVPSDR